MRRREFLSLVRSPARPAEFRSDHDLLSRVIWKGNWEFSSVESGEAIVGNAGPRGRLRICVGRVTVLYVYLINLQIVSAISTNRFRKFISPIHKLVPRAYRQNSNLTMLRTTVLVSPNVGVRGGIFHFPHSLIFSLAFFPFFLTRHLIFV